jgi:ABC-type lipoprotein release transport system permease subunit
MLLTLLVAIVASLCAGFYPAWRICRTPAAYYLKLQ